MCIRPSWDTFKHPFPKEGVNTNSGPKTNFLLLWIDLIFLTFRGNDRNTYPITFGLELIILGLWIAPMYHVATLIHENLGLDIPTEKSTWASMVIFGLNM